MVFIDCIFSGLAAFGTIFLASITYLSIRESRRKEDKADRLAILSEKIKRLYVPLYNEVFKAQDGNIDTISMFRIATLNYILAEDETRKAIDTIFSHFIKIDLKKPQETKAMMYADNLSMKMAIKKDYEKLIRQFYYERGFVVPDNFKIPDFADGM
jgi:hypothetical protein